MHACMVELFKGEYVSTIMMLANKNIFVVEPNVACVEITI
jgi:hypothetical protein